MLRARYGATAVALTDSGTLALVVGLRSLLPRGGTVALPAYACVDLVAAAILDPDSSAPLRQRSIDTRARSRLAATRGGPRRRCHSAVAPLYGYPVDMVSVRDIASAAGVQVIEDAAQHAGGRVSGVPVGASGPVTVLSFGRGKGTTGGRGGAAFATDGARPEVVARARSAWIEGAGTRTNDRRAGWDDLGRAVAQWAFGRPALYAIPASIPALGLGQTVYRPAPDPGRLSRSRGGIACGSGLSHEWMPIAISAHSAQHGITSDWPTTRPCSSSSRLPACSRDISGSPF